MLIRPKIPIFIRKSLKATRFWQDNFIILREFKHFRAIAIAALVFTLLGSLLEGATVGLIASFLQGLTNPNEPPIQVGIQWFDRWFLATDALPKIRIYRLSILILSVIWLRTGFYYLGRLYSKLSEINLVDRIRKSLFEKLQSFNLSYYAQSRYGDLVNSFTTEVNQLKQACQAISFLITRSSLLLAYIISMFLLSWQLSIGALMLYGLLSVGLTTLIGKIREASFDVPIANNQVTCVAIEFISGIRTVKASAAENFERKRFDFANSELLKAETRVGSLSEIVHPLAEGLSSSLLIVMVVVAFVWFVADGNFASASLLTFMFVLFRMMPLVSQINAGRQQLSSLYGSMDNIKKLLQTEPKSKAVIGNLHFSKLKQAIEFCDVDFKYDLNSDELILNNITFSIEKGQTVAFVGASGAGKTTLADLIPRFYEPSRGTIFIDGIDLREFDVDSLRRQLSIVSQDTFIFNNSIRYNIAYGLENVDEESIIEASKLANAWKFIQELPEGLNTILGDRGVRLSGGQRQRIAIARALLRQPEILILDEATSALDSVTEQLIQESLAKLSKDKTVIAIAHRLSTIANADKVVVLEQGRIVEQGSYKELLAKKGKLWKYHQKQYELSQAS
jgi:ATP-binding cassette, subfamily B, bacterial MsbA